MTEYTSEQRILNYPKQDIQIIDAINILTTRSQISLLDLLEELSEYMDNKADVRDGSEGDVLPNTEMSLGQYIDNVLEIIKGAIDRAN